MARLHIPKPLRDQFVSPARLMTMPVLVLGYVFGILQFGIYGFLIVTIALLAGIVAALWVDSARLETDLTTTHSLVSSRDEQLQSQQRRLDELEDEVDRVAELEGENLALEADLAEARGQLTAPQASLRQLHHSLDFHIRIIDVVQKHRALEHDGFAEWPVLSITTFPEDGTIAVLAHVEPSSERLANEPVSLMNIATASVMGNGIIALAEAQQIEARFEEGSVAPEIPEALEAQGHVVPDYYSLRLTGLTLTPWLELDDPSLAELRERLRELSRALASAATPRVAAAQGELDAAEQTDGEENRQ